MRPGFLLWAQPSQELSPAAFRELCASAEILEQDTHGLKVLRLADGDMLKVFRVKRVLSSAHVYSYARRFCRNATRLGRLGVPTVTVKQLYHFSDSSNSAVRYAPLPGRTLRELGRIDQLEDSLLESLGIFISKLHFKGIYFRSLHLGNIVQTPEGKLGLIDVADMHFFPWSLSCRRRIRNFNHLRRPQEDAVSLGPDAWRIMRQSYLREGDHGCARWK